MADALGWQSSIDAFRSVLNTMQAYNLVVDSLTGATPAAPSGTVCKDGLCMDTTEVTEFAYAAVMGKSPSSNGPQMPVRGVSFNNAEEYCNRVGKRLPTGEEWEKFAGTKEFATANGKLVGSGGKKEANFASDGPMNVKSFQPNSNGMYDMTGNVWEWVNDGDVFTHKCGGSWNNSGSDYLSMSFRHCYSYPGGSVDAVGFRCVVSFEDSKK